MSFEKNVLRSHVRAPALLLVSCVALVALGCGSEQAGGPAEAAGASAAVGGVGGILSGGGSGSGSGTGGVSAGSAAGTGVAISTAGASGSGGNLGVGGAAASTGGAAGTGGTIGTGGGQGGATSAGGTAGKGGSGGTSGAGGPPPKLTIWIAGDSTVKTYTEPNTDGNNGVSLYGWGQEIGQLLSSQAKINNQANGGRSVATFMWPAARDAAGNDQCVDALGTPKFQTDTAGNKVD